MAFAFNKDVKLRSLIGDEKFTRLINKTVDLSSNLDKVLCISLLDKSK